MPVTDPNTLTRGIKAQFQRAYASVLESVEMTGIESVATTIVSDGASETYNWLGDVPAIKEWLADKTMGDQQIKPIASLIKIFTPVLLSTVTPWKTSKLTASLNGWLLWLGPWLYIKPN